MYGQFVFLKKGSSRNISSVLGTLQIFMKRTTICGSHNVLSYVEFEPLKPLGKTCSLSLREYGMHWPIIIEEFKKYGTMPILVCPSTSLFFLINTFI